MLRNSPVITLILIIFCLQGIGAFSQDTSCVVTDNKKAIELYNKGTDKKKYQQNERMAFLKQAIDLEPDYVAANFALGEELVKYALLNKPPDYSPSVPYFMAVIKACPHYHSDPYYYAGITSP